MCQYKCQVQKDKEAYLHQQHWSCGQSQPNYILDDAIWPGVATADGKCSASASLPPPPPPPDIIAQHLEGNDEQVASSSLTPSDLSSSYFLEDFEIKTEEDVRTVQCFLVLFF